MSDIHTADQQEHLWRSRQARVIRTFRKVHRITGVLLFLMFILIALTGLLLGWKKHSGGYLLPESRTGTSTDLSHWLPVDSLHRLAVGYLRDSVSPALSPELERIDMRPDKGMVKFVFARHFWGLQLDGTTGRLLHIERRRSDFIEKVHDGSIFDQILGFSGNPVKLLFTTLSGLSLLTFTVTGFWLWYGPKHMRRHGMRRKATDSGRSHSHLHPPDGS